MCLEWMQTILAYWRYILFGTVEQQGRLTLHLHMLLWLEGHWHHRNLEIENESWVCFQKKMVEYLWKCAMGEFITGSLEDVKKMWHCRLDDAYKIQLKHFQYHLHSNVTRMNVGNSSCSKINWLPNDYTSQDYCISHIHSVTLSGVVLGSVSVWIFVRISSSAMSTFFLHLLNFLW